MAYTTVADLLVEQIGGITPELRTKYVDAAAEEMDGKLGFVYQLPITPAELPLNERLLLKSINTRLATGMLLLALDAPEDSTQHAYGVALVRMARSELNMIANGEVALTWTKLHDPETAKVPGITNHDAESAVDAFENHVLRGQPWYWRPGAVIPPISRGW